MEIGSKSLSMLGRRKTALRLTPYKGQLLDDDVRRSCSCLKCTLVHTRAEIICIIASSARAWAIEFSRPSTLPLVGSTVPAEPQVIVVDNPFLDSTGVSKVGGTAFLSGYQGSRSMYRFCFPSISLFSDSRFQIGGSARVDLTGLACINWRGLISDDWL